MQPTGTSTSTSKLHSEPDESKSRANAHSANNVAKSAEGKEAKLAKVVKAFNQGKAGRESKSDKVQKDNRNGSKTNKPKDDRTAKTTFFKDGGPLPGTNVHTGSYRGYYNQRGGDKHATNDNRLPLIRSVLNKYSRPTVLDIGCNDGSLTLQVARRNAIAMITGLDLDSTLIRSARRSLRHLAKHARDIDREQSSNVNKDPIVSFPHNVLFRSEDFAAVDATTANGSETFDVILCLSVTKWVHIQHGDAGIRRLFQAAHRILTPGGCFILEAQPKKSYKLARKRGLAPASATFREFQIRPDQFDDVLLDEVGFGRVELLRDDSQPGRPYNRIIQVFYKLKDGERPAPRQPKGKKAKRAAAAATAAACEDTPKDDSKGEVDDSKNSEAVVQESDKLSKSKLDKNMATAEKDIDQAGHDEKGIASGKCQESDGKDISSVAKNNAVVMKDEENSGDNKRKLTEVVSSEGESKEGVEPERKKRRSDPIEVGGNAGKAETKADENRDGEVGNQKKREGTDAKEDCGDDVQFVRKRRRSGPANEVEKKP